MLGAVVLNILNLVESDDAVCDGSSCSSGALLNLDGIDSSELFLLQTDLHVHTKAAQTPIRGKAHGDGEKHRQENIQADGQVDDENEGTAFWQTGIELREATADESRAARAAAMSSKKPLGGAEAFGLKTNAAGDLSAFVTAIAMYSFMIIACVVFFMVARNKYPMTYQNNLALNSAPLDTIPEGTWGWLKAAWGVTTADAMENAGLDQAMLLEFMNLGMKIMACIGIPMFFLMGPIHCVFGGHAAGEDHLSYFSFGNVTNGSRLYWIHAFVVWAVVLTVQSFVFKAQSSFLLLRFQWLRELPNPRANTILVEGIPPEHQSDEALKAYFDKMFGGVGKVTSSYVVRCAPELEALWRQWEDKKQALEKARFKARNANAVDADKVTVVALQDELADLERQVQTEQLKVKSKSSVAGPDGFHTSSGFVSFQDRSNATLALSMQLGQNADDWEISLPPEPNSVLYSDLQQGATSSQSFTILGYLLTAGLYMLYMPAVIGITQIAVTINMGPFQSLWQAFAPTVGLQVMVAFLPTFLILIFRFCFTLKDDVWAQQILQNWYFVFQVVFVILITAIGSSTKEFMQTMAEQPFEVFALLGSTMPPATHFYMNYLVLQWGAHALDLTRYVPLGKWFLFRSMFDDETARQMSEPEDQDYYGIGSRSCRQTINLCIGIIYGTLSPPITVLAFLEFLVSRVFYGYLVIFAETRKPDLGGVFWVQQLRHVFVGSVIYVIMMTAVLIGRATSKGPGLIAAASLVHVIWSMQKFETAYSWQKLPFKELIDPSQSQKSIKVKANAGEYVQPFMK